jgi:hypothetical protein
VVAHANVPTGISELVFYVNGTPKYSYPLTGDDYGATFAQMGIGWIPQISGQVVLEVVALGMTGQPAASDKVLIYLQFPEQEGGPEVDEEPEAPAPSYSRCDLFNPESASLTLFDIPPGSTELTAYINFGSLPGLEEPVEDDQDPWEYTAFVGDTEATDCRFEGYAGRLYCYFSLEERVLDSLQPVLVFVNLCDTPIFSHEEVSILAPVCQGDMNQYDCEATGGTWHCDRFSCICRCP